MEFSRSLTAQGAALSVIEVARSAGYIDGPVAVTPALADSEKTLFCSMFSAVGERRQGGNHELSPDEISSMFTFVFARAAEAVTNMFNRQPDKFEIMGLFDGKVPIYAAEELTGYFKKLTFPTDCASAYWEWFHNQALPEGLDPILPLFEALKWTFRLSCHIAIVFEEQRFNPAKA